MTSIRTLILALVLLGPGAALAQDQVNGVGATYRALRLTLTGTTAARGCVQQGSDCALFPAGLSRFHIPRLVQVSLLGSPTCCCFVGDPNLSVTGGNVTDASGPYGSGPGACACLNQSGALAFEKPDRRVFREAAVPGTREGLAPNVTPVNGAGAGDALYAPCAPGAAVGAAYGGGTCPAVASVSGLQSAAAGSFLVCELNTTGSGEAAIVTVQKQRLPRVQE